MKKVLMSWFMLFFFWPVGVFSQTLMPDDSLLVSDPMLPILIENEKGSLSSEGIFQGEFEIVNRTADFFQEASWKIEIYSGGRDSSKWNNEFIEKTGLVKDYFSSDYFVLNPQERVKKIFSVKISPNLPSGIYTARIFAIQKTEYFGWKDVEFEIKDSRGGFLEVIPGSFRLKDEEKKLDYPANYGGRFETGRSPVAVIDLLNSSNAPLDVEIGISLWKRYFSQENKLGERKNEKITILPGEIKKFNFSLPKDLSGGSYFGRLDFQDSSGEERGPEQNFHWVIQGENGEIVNLNLNKSSFSVGEGIVLSAEVSARADGLPGKYQVVGKILDSQERVLFEGKRDFSFPNPQNENRVEFSSWKLKDGMEVASARIELYSSQGNLLDSAELFLQGLNVDDKRKDARIFLLDRLEDWIILIVVFLAIISFASVLFWKMKKRSGAGMAVLALIFCGGMFFSQEVWAHNVCDSAVPKTWQCADCNSNYYCCKTFTTCANAQGGVSSAPSEVEAGKSFSVSGNSGVVSQTPCNNPHRYYGAEAWHSIDGGSWIYDEKKDQGHWTFFFTAPSGGSQMKVRIRTTAIGWEDGNSPYAKDQHEFEVTINIRKPQPELDFSANPQNISQPQSSVLSWSSQNTASCLASGAWGGWKKVSGSESVYPVKDSLYHLECWNSSGASSGVRSVQVGVYSCIGSTPNNSQLCVEGGVPDDHYLPGNIPKIQVDYDGCNSLSKCQYRCNYEGATAKFNCQIPIQGKCGLAVLQTFCQKPESKLCDTAGGVSEVALDKDGKRWKWKCQGLFGGGDSESCYALKSCAYQEVSPN